MKIIDKIKDLWLPKCIWNKYYTKEELKLDIPKGSMYDLIKESVDKYPNCYAYEYLGTKVTYKKFLKDIDKASRSFRYHGIRRGDVVSICMPNTPEAITLIYALNKIGAIVEMIHPLSSENEIKNYLISTGSVMLVMIDACYEKVKDILKETNVYKTIVVSAKDSMPLLTKIGYRLKEGFKIKKPKHDSEFIYYKRFMHSSINYRNIKAANIEGNDPAVILHSGGTTGNPKGVVLSNSNFNALAKQAEKMLSDINPGDKILGILPLFHGFGLGVGVHVALNKGMEIIIVPKFDNRHFDKLLIKHQPNLVVGVPTLFEALINNDNKKLDLECVKHIISGGDSLSIGLERKVNTFLHDHYCQTDIVQGYGMTECLASTCVAFKLETNKEGSIGIPLPGNYFKIVTPNTQDEVKPGVDGEICICGPTVMMGYLDNEKETNEVLQLHKDGHVWLHTGDMGMMDKDGVFFYRQRIKRMLISSGFNIYPSQIENVINSHEAVLNCSVIGIPHPYKVQVAKAFIVLKPGVSPNIFTKNSIKEHCKKNLATYSLPYEYEFRKSLPKTMIGKVDFRKLQEEEENKVNEERNEE